MAISNKMSDLLDRIEDNLGLIFLTPHLPKEMNKEAWGHRVIEKKTLKTFSRYYYHQVRFVVNKDSCNIRKENGITTYYIKDEYLQGLELLGVRDIDWNDFSSDNLSVSQTAGYGYYSPDYIGCPQCSFETMVGYQMMADMQSLGNRGIYIDFQYPNKLQLKGSGNQDINLNKFVVDLLVEHPNLNTISPTKMETFEALAQADVATFLFKNLRYVDGLDRVYVTLDLKLSELEQEAGKRDQIIEDIKNSYVSASNDNIPYILTV